METLKISLEGREYELRANGEFMKVYQEKFKETLMVALYRMTRTQDILTCARLIYCAAFVEDEFDKWLASFETPLFCLACMPEVYEYISRSIKPTVDPKDKGKASEENVKKKKN